VLRGLSAIAEFVVINVALVTMLHYERCSPLLPTSANFRNG